MLVVDRSIPDPVEAISRELEFQRKRGLTPEEIVISPEVQELMRLRHRLPAGARIIDHDGIPVTVNPKYIGPRAWTIRFKEGAAPTERQIDEARSGIKYGRW